MLLHGVSDDTKPSIAKRPELWLHISPYFHEYGHRLVASITFSTTSDSNLISEVRRESPRLPSRRFRLKRDWRAQATQGIYAC